MRIAIVTGEYPPMEGGVGAYTARLAAALADQDHEVHVLTSHTPATEPADDEVSRAGKPTLHRAVRHWGLGRIGHVRRLILELAPDVIDIQYEPAAYAMKAGIHALPSLLRSASSPVVVTFHDLLPPYLIPKAGRLRAWTVDQLALHASGAIVTNREDENALRKRLEAHSGPRDKPPPVRLIPIGSNITAQPPPDFDRDRWRARHGLRPEDLTVAFFGFMNRTKGIETLIEAAARINSAAGTGDRDRTVHLLFIGGRTGTSDVTNERYAGEIDALITAHGLDPFIHRTGYADASEVSAAFYAADVCALPYTEGANLRHGTLHAALAHGCPTITTAPTALLPELRDGEHALLIPSHSAGALAEAILILSRDRALRRRLGDGARTLARGFEWPQIAAEVAHFMSTLLQQR